MNEYIKQMKSGTKKRFGDPTEKQGMDKIYFHNIDEACRMWRKAVKHNCHKLKETCENAIACIEYDQYLYECAL